MTMIDTTELLKTLRISHIWTGSVIEIGLEGSEEINKYYLSKLKEKYNNKEEFLEDVFNAIYNKGKEELALFMILYYLLYHLCGKEGSLSGGFHYKIEIFFTNPL